MERIQLNKETLDQGAGASRAFEGEKGVLAIEKIYGESAKFFAEEIKKILPPRLEPYSMSVLDVGSHKGELLRGILEEFDDRYKFNTTVIDANEDAIKNNVTKGLKVVGDVSSLPFKDMAFDVTIMRYVLPWNSVSNQKNILDEVNRVSNKFAIVQHSGATREGSLVWQSKFHELFTGCIPKLKRENVYFSSPTEIETWMNEVGIKHQTVQERTIPEVSSLFISKYELSSADAEKVKEILKSIDYIEQVAWVLKRGG